MWGPLRSRWVTQAQTTMPAFYLQVNESMLKVPNPLDQATAEKQSTDSGAYSIGH